MESLESKLDRLSLEQQKEIEDFVDFLLSRSGPVCITPNASCNPPPVLNVAPPPLSLIEPVHGGETRPFRLQDLASTDDQAAQPAGDNAGSVPLQEIGGGGVPDRVSHDYMDYGQFEKQTSPATEAVKKVKRKIIAREQQERPRHLLDWVD
jgi:hypothetical protein